MKKISLLLPLILLFHICAHFKTQACTGVCLISDDGGVVYGRSMEWGAFDLNSRVAIIPRGYTFTGLTPNGYNGKIYQSKYGVVGLDMLHKDLIADGMNEEGLVIGIFYHPGFAEYPDFNVTQIKNTISAQELTNFILTQFATIDEVKSGIQPLKVVGVVEEKLGIPIEAHWMVTDKSGESIVIEYTKGELVIHDAPLGVITNAPNYDWHMTNLRNHINLSMYSLPNKEIANESFAPIGAGSGMIGLPGDNTPPSRFVRAVAWSQTTRSLSNASEATYELLRILDNFQLPLGPDGAEGASEKSNVELMRSSTIWTTVWNQTDMILNYHTQHNRRVRQLHLTDIDFELMQNEIVHITLDEQKEQDILKITPRIR